MALPLWAWAVEVEVANDTSQRDLPQFIGESLDELKAVTAGSA
jgi:hypothetical protein